MNTLPNYKRQMPSETKQKISHTMLSKNIKHTQLGHKHVIQNLIFPDGIVWSIENDDIEPLSKNEFLLTYGLKSGNYEQNESGQTDFSTNLSAVAPPRGLEPRTP